MGGQKNFRGDRSLMYDDMGVSLFEIQSANQGFASLSDLIFFNFWGSIVLNTLVF